MNQESRPVNITILDKDYLISCNDDEREQLYSAAKYLNNKLHELKNSGKVIGAERIAVMAALNIANEYLAYKEKNVNYTQKIDTAIKRIQDKVNNAMGKEGGLKRYLLE
jgi:cell division protein ZapA